MTIRKWRKTNPQYRSLSRQTRALGFEIGAAFRYHKRDEGRRKDRSLASIANYSQGGDISPDIIAEEYDPVIWQSLWWHPDAAFCQKTYLNLPHTMIVLQMTVELDDRIFQVEVLTALTIMLTLLEGDRFELHNTVPVMVISVMGRMQVRVLQFHYSREGLVVTKTRFMSFATDESTTIGLGVLMGLMSSKTSGNTKDPSNILKPVSPPTTPTQASSEPPVVDPNLTASRRILQALHVGKYSSRAKRSRSKTHGIPDFDPQPPNQISAPTHKAQEDTKEQKPPGSHFAYPEQLFTGPPD
ncbi:hypothetical protein PENANT_c008G10612 [Penicillium antarcticum]|uniref:Uncharacterized protein n=1 Tax=Penicillium antarcticum TaxID=416450 RepID=A0A1V6QA38_9EURO|nr:hypothetical protein PENANT_c008G10612 [Penicillium antarcticum]